MEGKTFLRQPDNTLIEMTEQPYAAEALLQRLLASHPDLLAGDQIDSESPRRWLFIGREIGVPGETDGGNWWSLDHLFLDQDAVPTFVEVKRSSDTRSRREVVAQMLDYAANATEYWPASRMREDHAKMCEAADMAPEAHFAESFELDLAQDIEEFWRQAERNLRDGRVRLLFVADRIPVQLRRIVEFLNKQMDPAQVLALEVKQFVDRGSDHGFQMLVPRIIGNSETTRKSQTAPRPTAEKMPEISPEDLRAKVPASVGPLVDALLDRAIASGWFISPKSYSKWQTIEFGPNETAQPFSISTEGLIWINLRKLHFHDVLSTDESEEIYRLIREIDRKKTPETKSTVGISAKFLGTRENQERVLRIFDIVEDARDQSMT
jgi:hypothetical protein